MHMGDGKPRLDARGYANLLKSTISAVEGQVAMVWYSVAVVINFLVDVFTVRWMTADKDLEILLLRQQLRVLERNLGQRARPSRWQKCFLAVLLIQLK